MLKFVLSIEMSLEGTFFFFATEIIPSLRKNVRFSRTLLNIASQLLSQEKK